MNTFTTVILVLGVLGFLIWAFQSASSPSKRRVKSGNQAGRGIADARRTEPPPLSKAARDPVEDDLSGLSLDVVGESFYRDNLVRLAGREPGGVDLEFEAELIPEPENPHDPNAVRVVIQGLQVGYLPRDEASEYVPAIRRRIAAERKAECTASISAGYQKRDGSWADYSVEISFD